MTSVPDPPATPDSNSSALWESLRYGVSLPERLLRSACGLTAGTARELAEFVVPRSFQSSKTYEVVVRNSLNFLVSDIGGVESPANSEQRQAEDFVARKAVGNFMDFAGLATLHVSPLWVLAIVSDVAYGAKSYTQELARELQAQGLIDDASTIHHIDDVLDAVQRASGSAASTLDQPPLSVEALRTSLDQTRAALAGADPRQLFPEAELNRYWAGMRDLASRENVSLLGVSGVLAMQTASAVRSVTQGAWTGVSVAGQLVNRTIFTHYVDALSQVRQKGLWASVRDTYEPYVDAVWKNFRGDRRTWTDSLLDSSTYQRAWTSVRGWFQSSDSPPTQPPPGSPAAPSGPTSPASGPADPAP
ncbi:MAG: hypothetical protein KF774_10150 [Planctomyces sp.]|nr:hypothetical protein [Planctomyces sp.]